MEQVIKGIAIPLLEQLVAKLAAELWIWGNCVRSGTYCYSILKQDIEC